MGGGTWVEGGGAWDRALLGVAVDVEGGGLGLWVVGCGWYKKGLWMRELGT